LEYLAFYKVFIHFLAILGVFSLWGYLATDNKYILMGMAVSFLGLICGSFIRIVDAIKSK
jgi:hypothetical protein